MRLYLLVLIHFVLLFLQLLYLQFEDLVLPDIITYVFIPKKFGVSDVFITACIISEMLYIKIGIKIMYINILIFLFLSVTAA